MSERSVVGELLRDLCLGAIVGLGGAAIYGVIEAATNTATGLYLPLRLWMFAVMVYAVIGLFAVSLVISTLAARSREQAESARRREIQAVALYELSRDLATASELDDILQVVIRHVGETFSREAAKPPSSSRHRAASSRSSFSGRPSVVG